MRSFRRELSRYARVSAIAGLSVLQASAALGWGRDVSKAKDDYRYLNETAASDLVGRWRLKSVLHEGRDDEAAGRLLSWLDVVACGGRYCGIAVGADGTCGAMMLGFEDRGSRFAQTGPNEVLQRFSGTLDLHDATAANTVFVDVIQNDCADDRCEGRRPRYDDETILTIGGSSDGSYGRVFPLEVTLSYAGRAICKALTS